MDAHEIIERWRNKRILVLGDFCIDQWEWGRVDRISPEAPVPVFVIERETSNRGMSGLVADMVNALGGAATLATVVPDMYVMHQFVGLDIILAHEQNRTAITKRRSMASVQGRHTYHQLLRADRDNPLPITEQSIDTLMCEIQRRAYPDAVIVCDYNKGTITHHMSQYIIRFCRNHDIPSFVDPGNTDWSIYHGATCIKANRKQANGNVPTPYAQYVIVTKDSDGCVLHDMCQKEGHAVEVPGKRVDVADSTGAGDSFIACLSLAMSAGATFLEACKLANTCAALEVTKLGCVPIGLDELKMAVAHHVRTTS